MLESILILGKIIFNMAKKIYTDDITKHTDWGGDASTGNLPVAGECVQKFIKNTLQSRIGYIYDDAANNRCLGFADEEDYDLYISDPETYQDLVVNTWYNYHPPVPVTLDYPAYYGTVNDQITVTTAVEKITNLSSTTSTSATCNSSKPYVYIALYKNYRLTKAITSSNEDVKDDFVKLDGEFLLNSVSYTLYELHADSGLPLDVNISLSFSKN